MTREVSERGLALSLVRPPGNAPDHDFAVPRLNFHEAAFSNAQRLEGFLRQSQATTRINRTRTPER